MADVVDSFEILEQNKRTLYTDNNDLVDDDIVGERDYEDKS
jgi:hypothetical protein